MSQYHIKNPDDLVQCPFDNTHMIRMSRMQYHLLSCKKNHPGKKYVVCPFNARHYVLKHEELHHISRCPDRAVIELDLLHAQKEDNGSYFQGDCSVPDYKDKVVAYDDGEDWDTDTDHSRGTFICGKTNLNDHFNSMPQIYEPEGQMRLPHGVPQVLQTHNGVAATVYPVTNGYHQTNGYHINNGTFQTEQDAGGHQLSSRLPNTLPLTTPPTMVVGGLGRGRGFVPPQHNNFTPGGVSGTKQQQQQVESNFSLKQAPRGRGRGKKTRTDASNNPGLPYSDDDAASTSSVSSGSSRSSRGAPRCVNASPIGVLNSVQPSPAQPPPTVAPPQQPVKARGFLQQNNLLQANGWSRPEMPPTRPSVQPPPMQSYPLLSNPALPNAPRPVHPHFGLLGIGRGKGRGSNATPGATTQPNFIVPNVNHVIASSEDDRKKQIRKCQKKMREIEALEEKSADGTELNADEQAKIDTRKGLMKLLKQLDELTI